MSRSESAALAFILLAVTASTGTATPPPPAHLTAPSLRAGLLDAQRKIRSVYVEYRAAGYDEKRFPPGTYLQRTVAAKAPCFLFHRSAHGHDRLDWRDDFLQQTAYVTPRRLYNAFPVNRCYFESALQPKDGLPGTLPQEFFFLATGIWPLEACKPPQLNDRPFVLREVAAAAEYSTVRPNQEDVGGRWCHVLERPGYDRLWIDVERGYALTARETCDKVTGALAQRFELGDHREAAPGIWLPGWVRNTQFDAAAPDEAGRNRKVFDGRHNILVARVNDVDDRLFEFVPRPGELKLVLDGLPRSEPSPGGLDHLDELASWVKRNARVTPAADSSFGYWAGVPALLVVLAWETWRGLRRRARRPPPV